MYGTFVLLDQAGKLERGQRVYLGEVKGKDESWLQDTLFNHPELIPIEDIDPAFAPLVPLCKELRTLVGRIDAVFINERGRLTIVECKLWKNPQARREVVAQALDYVSALSEWSYADLQRQVSEALHRQGNILLEVVRGRVPTGIREAEFVDAVSRSLREGRILVLLAGDGICEGIQSLTELVSRSATKAFKFGLIETAVYRFGKNRFAIQPRVLAKTETLEREMTIVNMKGEMGPVDIEELVGHAPDITSVDGRGGNKERLRAWWEPILKMKFDDPEQESPQWLVTNNIVLPTPYPGIQIKAWGMVDGNQMGVYMTGTQRRLEAAKKLIKRDKSYLLDHLPDGTIIDPGSLWPVILKNEDFAIRP